MGQPLRRRLAIAGICAAVFFAAANAEAVAPSKVSMDAKVIDGEVYVKASSLIAQLGGTGSYDSKSKKYDYAAANAVPDVVKKVSPSVVAIIGKPQGQYESNRFALAHGTGVILKSDGLILTNTHVVYGMDHIVVVTSDGKEYEGTRKYLDFTSDLALVQIKATGLKPASFAPAPLNVQVGETVVAIGTPVSFALRNTATVGVISGMNRSVSTDYSLLQTDAAINPGNSGGPLVNMKGEVVGINSMKFVDVDIDSMGFAIPADTAQHIINQILKFGKVMRPTAGAWIWRRAGPRSSGLPTEEPMKVIGVSSAEAQSAGIETGDQLYSVNGKQVSTLVELNELLKAYLPGQTVSVTLMSDGDLVTRKLVLATSASK